MNNMENAKKYATISAICYFIYAAYNIIDFVIRSRQSEYVSITALTVIFWIIPIGVGVALILKNKKVL